MDNKGNDFNNNFNFLNNNDNINQNNSNNNGTNINNANNQYVTYNNGYVQNNNVINSNNINNNNITYDSIPFNQNVSSINQNLSNQNIISSNNNNLNNQNVSTVSQDISSQNIISNNNQSIVNNTSNQNDNNIGIIPVMDISNQYITNNNNLNNQNVSTINQDLSSQNIISNNNQSIDNNTSNQNDNNIGIIPVMDIGNQNSNPIIKYDNIPNNKVDGIDLMFQKEQDNNDEKDISKDNNISNNNSNKDYNKKKPFIYRLLSNRIFQLLILIAILIFVSILSFKAINSRKELDEYEIIEKDLEEKLDNKVIIGNNNKTTSSTSIIDCLSTPLYENELTSEMNNIKDQIQDIMNETNYNFAFKYQDIVTGFYLSYNSEQGIFAASTIKAPEAIYIFEEAEKGNVNLEDTIKYTSNYYSDGTGILKNKSFNVDYTIKELVSYSIINSDNAAHLMLNNKYKSENIYNYWKDKGTKVIYSDKTAWGNISADDATIYMTELYNYINGNNKYSNDLLEYFKKSWKVISVPDEDIEIASKSGWSGNSLHDAALIFDDNPYTLVILSNRGYVDYQEFFKNISNLVYEFHTKYWKEKINICTKSVE